jgi:uncharacterized protein (DUF302 family)
VISSRPFDEIVSALDAVAGHPDAQGALGSSGFMEFMRFGPDKILAKEPGGSQRIRRLAIGSPLVMKEMVNHVPDAASYVPVTVLVVEGADSVRLSYDTMASLIASYVSAEASEVARDLDEKVESLLIEIAQ